MEKPLNIILLGISGSGKGVQAELLSKELHKKQKTFIIGMGDLLRSLAQQPTSTGARIKEVLRRGHLVPFPVALSYWIHEVSAKVAEDEGIITDGSPRSVWEAEALDIFLEFLGRKEYTRVLFLAISEDAVTKRLLKRGRADDNALALAARFAFFREHVMPVVTYYQATGRLLEINADQSVEEVHGDIMKALR